MTRLRTVDELSGDQGTWRLGDDSVTIRYHQGRRTDRLLRQLGQCRVPLAAVASVEFHPRVKRRRWSLRMVLREGADPYAAVGAYVTPRAWPFRLTGRSRSPLLAEFWADQLTSGARMVADTAGYGVPAPSRELLAGWARALVPGLPVQVRSSEGSASFDGEVLRLRWSGSASLRKRRAGLREFRLPELLRVEWVPGDGWEWDLLRVVTAETQRAPAAPPKRDLACLRCYPGEEGAAGLLLAATVTAHLWSRPADPPAIETPDRPAIDPPPPPAPPGAAG